MAKKLKEVEKQPDYSVGVARGSLKVELLKNRSAARCSVETNVVDYRRDKLDPQRTWSEVVVFRVASLWMHPTQNEPLRMILHKPRHRSWVYASELAEEKNNEIEYGTDLFFKFDRSKIVYRFGYRNYPTIYNSEDACYIHFYNSKSIAIRAILEEFKSVAPVGGIDIVNFQAVNDDLLSSMGMVRLPDVLGNSEAMWYGNPGAIARRGSNGGFQQSQNIASFMDILAGEVAK